MNWIRLIVNIVVSVSAYASILSLYLTRWPNDVGRPTWHVVALFAIGLLYLLFVIYESFQLSRESHRSFSSDRAINRYMRKWVSNRGRTLILSRDMSWGGDYDTARILKNKASSHELIIYMQHETELSKKLLSAGAEIHYYGNSGFSPKSRFTMVGSGKDGSRIAIGTERKGKHLVYEYDRGEHPITALSDDLIELLKVSSQ